MPGQVIIVTGATGSGKTTTCREVIAQAEELWLHYGIDMFLGQSIARKFVDGGEREGASIRKVPDDPDDPTGPAHLSLGTQGADLLATFHEMIASAAATGRTMVLDHIMTVNPPILQDCVRRLAHLPVLFVGLRPDRHLIADRIESRFEEVAEVLGEEQARANNAGTLRVSEFIDRETFSHDHFDMILDTGALSPQEAAARIVERATKGPSGTAFAQLAERFGP